MSLRLITLKNSSSKDMSLQTAGVPGAKINLRQKQRMNSSVYMGLVNTQNGISGSTIGTPRTQKEDTSFPMAISKMSIVAGCLLRRVGLPNVSISKSQMQPRN